MSRAVILTCAIVLLTSASKPCQAQVGPGSQLSPPQLQTPTRDPEKVKLGRELFMRDWLKHKPERGDGLGPMYNASSCVECHVSGGVGGSGNGQHNVDMVSIVSPMPSDVGFPKRLELPLKKVHPDLSATSMSVTVHRSGREVDGSDDKEYQNFRKQLLHDNRRSSRASAPFGPPATGARTRRAGGFVLEFSQRSTPALFGAGLIDQIRDSVLIQMARHQKDNVPGISGRIPQTSGGAVGRFGWRGQVGSLNDFVLGACVNELGLQVADGQHEPQNPIPVLTSLTAEKAEDLGTWSLAPNISATKPDLTANETQALTVFVASLDAPLPLNGLTLQQSEMALEGSRLFEKTGCSHCHVPHMGPAQYIYSDLLLHDMGPALADAVSAIPEIDARQVPTTSGYYGGMSIELLVNVTTNIRQEWRTPPLWGVRDSAPYLHDGRAISVDEAIRMHGGEAAAIARKYRALKPTDRDKVIAFVNTLAPPGARPQSLVPFRGRGGGLGSGFFSQGIGGLGSGRGGFSAFNGSGVFSIRDLYRPND